MKNLYMIIDTETAGTLEEPLVYDIGFVIVDRTGKVYDSGSFVIPEVFIGMSDLMQSAYYANKIPEYWQDIQNGTRSLMRFFDVRNLIWDVIEKYNIQAVVAHNMRFDYHALNNTCRALSININYFFPYKTPLWCTLTMARQVIAPRPVYRQWCTENGFTAKNGSPRCTAEVLYRFISNQKDFVEKHTGIDDVNIEKDIFAYILRQHKAMRRTYWEE